MKEQLMGFTKKQLQEFFDDAYDQGFTEAARQIKKAVFGAKNMLKAKQRVGRIENAVIISMNERKLKRELLSTSESGIKPESNISPEGGLPREDAASDVQPKVGDDCALPVETSGEQVPSQHGASLSGCEA